jgi:hypothetical protein
MNTTESESGEQGKDKNRPSDQRVPVPDESWLRDLEGNQSYEKVDAFGRPVEGDLAAPPPPKRKSGGMKKQAKRAEADADPDRPLRVRTRRDDEEPGDETSERPPERRIERESSHGAP